MNIHMLNNATILFSTLYEADKFGRYGVTVSVPDTYQLKPFTTVQKGVGVNAEKCLTIRCRLRNQDKKEEYKELRRGDIITIEVTADTYSLNGQVHIYPTIINIHKIGG